MTPEEMVRRAELGMEWRKAMAEAVAKARSEALEEAAMVAEGHLTKWHENTALCREIAAAIRALIPASRSESE